VATYHYIIIEGLFNYMCVCVEMGTRANNYKLQEFFHMKKVISQERKTKKWVGIIIEVGGRKERKKEGRNLNLIISIYLIKIKHKVV
jgi:hypothetical protein